MDISKETPKTEISSIRIKKILSKAGGVAKNLFIDALTKIATDTAKGYLGIS
jgi:hypothetical protein